MRKLEPVIARFVDAVLQAIREDALAELDVKLSARAHAATSSRSPAVAAPVARPRAASRKPARATKVAAVAPTPPKAAAPREKAHSPVAEITDPEWLLRDESATRAPTRPPDILATSDAMPASTPRPARNPTPIALRADEAIVRTSGGGVVIRRASGANRRS